MTSEPEIVHPVPLELHEPWLRTVWSNLLFDPDSPEMAARRSNRVRTWNPDRLWAVVDHGAVVGTLATEARTITVPGADGSTNVVPVDAVTGVSVSATHRRRGLLRRMITQSLADARDRGDALSVLIAAEWPIYGRYGYAPAVQLGRYTYRTRGPGAAPAGGDPTSVRPATADEVAALAPDVFALARRGHAGQMDRDGVWWPRRLGASGFTAVPGTTAMWVVHETDGAVDGLLGWRVTRDFDLDNRFGAVTVTEFVAASDTAYRDLWSYLAGIDAVEEVLLDDRPVDEPVRWLLPDGRALLQTATLDALWVRLLDVPAALGARAYAVPGELVLDVVDTDGAGYGAGTVALTASADGAHCEPTAAAAQLRVTQRSLASAYLGGHRLATLALAGGVEELAPGALALADLMFSTPRPPINQTHF
ncbi:putative GNAT family N-acetyltransferase [Jatrophihabitans fulvus]